MTVIVSEATSSKVVVEFTVVGVGAVGPQGTANVGAKLFWRTEGICWYNTTNILKGFNLFK